MARGWSLLLGIGLLAGAVWAGERSLEYRRHGIVVEGTVVEVHAQLTREGDSVSYTEQPVVRYQRLHEHQPRSMTFNWASPLFGRHAPGDKVKVRYLPDDPDAAREDSLLLDWAIPTVLLILGLAGVTGRLQGSRSDDYVIWRSSDD